MFNFHKNHRQLLIAITLGFLGLSLLIAVFPAYQIQENTEPLPNDEPLTNAELKGMQVFISEGCVACHTQQVRNIEMDNVWGNRPSIPGDYYYSKQRLDVWRQTPSILGSERTGPDLTNIGRRQPSANWHLLHLYNPRIVVEESIMPAYPWLFKYEQNPEEDAEVINVPKQYQTSSGKVVAKERAMNLVAYLQSLKQVPVDSAKKFIPAQNNNQDQQGNRANNQDGGNGEETSALDGAALYQNTCAQCHQTNGQGIPGAFPALTGSDIVNNQDPETHIKIIIQGYNENADFAPMPPFGSQLSNEEITAIVNHERTSWGNDAPEISVEEVEAVRSSVENLNQ